MRLWMLVPDVVFRTLERDGEVVTDGRRSVRDLRPAYRWMAEQMEERIGPPPRPGAFPLWAWAQWSGPHRRKPDMRCGGHAPTGAKCFRLTLDVPQSQVLLSDFDDWHSVLNNSFCAWNCAEFDSFAAKLGAAGIRWCGPHPEPFRSLIVQSWDRIFDIDRSDADPEWGTSPEYQSIQATFWRLTSHQVQKVEAFIAR